MLFRDKSFQPLQRVKHARSDSFELVWILRAGGEPKRSQHCGFPWQGVSAEKSDVTLMSELECDTLIWQCIDYIHVDLGLYHLLGMPEDQSHHTTSLQMRPGGRTVIHLRTCLLACPGSTLAVLETEQRWKVCSHQPHRSWAAQEATLSSSCLHGFGACKRPSLWLQP